MSSYTRMTQIKSFRANSPDELDEQVNSWIRGQVDKRYDTGFGTLDTNSGRTMMANGEDSWFCIITYSVNAGYVQRQTSQERGE